MSYNPLVIVVHGVGRQAELQTLKAFLEGSTAKFDIPNTYTRAQLAHHLRKGEEVTVDGVPFSFKEFNYSRIIRRHLRYAEEDPRTWIRSIRNRLREINRSRSGRDNLTFVELENVIDDILFATTLARLMAERFHFQTESIQYTALGFLQQVQLYIDHEPYRDEIDKKFQEEMNAAALASTEEPRKITLAAHSLGTVVVLRALLDADTRKETWLNSVERLVTFGSPLDLVFLLFPELFVATQPHSTSAIKWTNYTLGNDPIATDLALIRNWIEEKCPGLFMLTAPDEADLGPGTLTGAHTDYWHNKHMLDEICTTTEIITDQKTFVPDTGVECAFNEKSPPNQKRRKTKRRRRTVTTVFCYASMVAAAVVAWLVIVWWEENLKTHDASRVVLGNPFQQVGYWAGGWLMVISHIKCWSASKYYRLLYLFLCFIISAILISFLPGLPILGDLLPVFDLDRNPFLEGEKWRIGNFILILPFLSAFFGVISGWARESRRLRKSTVVMMLAAITVVLSLFVGTRHNPSNVSAEFGLLSLALGIWWLSVLLARIDEAFKTFVGGRAHLDRLSKIWNVRSKRREFRQT